MVYGSRTNKSYANGRSISSLQGTLPSSQLEFSWRKSGKEQSTQRTLDKYGRNIKNGRSLRMPKYLLMLIFKMIIVVYDSGPFVLLRK